MALLSLSMLLAWASVVTAATACGADDSTCELWDHAANSKVLLQRETSQLATEKLPHVHEAKPKKHTPKAERVVLGATATLNEAGYASVLSQNSLQELTTFAERIFSHMGLKVQQEYKVQQMLSKRPKKFEFLMKSVMKGLNEDKFLKSAIDAPKKGSDPSLNEDGYKYVLQLHDDKNMEEFIERVASKHGWTVADKGSLAGMAPFYSGTKDIQCFAALEEELQKVHDEGGWLIKAVAKDSEHKEKKSGNAPASELLKAMPTNTIKGSKFTTKKDKDATKGSKSAVVDKKENNQEQKASNGFFGGDVQEADDMKDSDLQERQTKHGNAETQKRQAVAKTSSNTHVIEKEGKKQKKASNDKLSAAKTDDKMGSHLKDRNEKHGEAVAKKEKVAAKKSSSRNVQKKQDHNEKKAANDQLLGVSEEANDETESDLLEQNAKHGKASTKNVEAAANEGSSKDAKDQEAQEKEACSGNGIHVACNKDRKWRL